MMEDMETSDKQFKEIWKNADDMYRYNLLENICRRRNLQLLKVIVLNFKQTINQYFIREGSTHLEEQTFKRIIHILIEHDWLEGVKVVVSQNADINAYDTYYRRNTCYQFTPLMYAIKIKSVPIFDFLLGMNADPHKTCPHTAISTLALAVKKSDQYMVKRLLDGYHVNTNIKMKAFYSRSNSLYNTGTVLKMVVRNIKISEEGHLKDIMVQIMSTLIQHGSSVTLHNMGVEVSPLFSMLGCSRFFPHVLKVLYEYGACLYQFHPTYIIAGEEFLRHCRTFNLIYANVNNFRWLLRHGYRFPYKRWWFYNFFEQDITSPIGFSGFTYLMLELLLLSGSIFKQEKFTGYVSKMIPMLGDFISNPPEIPVRCNFLCFDVPRYKDDNNNGVCDNENQPSYGPWDIDVRERIIQEKERGKINKQEIVELLSFAKFQYDIFPKFEVGPSNEERLNCLIRIQTFLETVQPLKLLCRTKLRRILPTLSPSYINQLPIPAELKRYLLCFDL